MTATSLSAGSSASWTTVVAAVATSLVLFWLWLAVRRWRERWRHRRRWLRARRAEADAVVLLERLGYIVVGEQVEGAYSIQVDGESVSIVLRADYVVARDGRRFVAEVKSGQFAPLLANRATRRQLLEYLVAFQVDGVLLVDGETRRVHQVEFPISARRPLESTPSAALGWMAAGLAALVAVIWILHHIPPALTP
jgi:hypothetical protein